MSLHRRSFLRRLGALGAAGAALPLLTPEAAAAARPAGALRLAHLTDIHLEDTPVARKGLAHCLKAAKEAGAEAILNTGDSFMRLDGVGRPKVEPQLRAWREVAAGSALPIHSCLGNHDLWIPPAAERAAAAGHPGLEKGGRADALAALGMPAAWHGVTLGRWRFLLLDSTAGATRYAFGAEQLAWLESELAAIPAGGHACLCTHVPIQSPGAWMWMVNRSGPEKWGFPFGDLHRDLGTATDLLRRFPAAKAVLSGHIHYVDAVEYLGVTHLNSGAVSGNWWKGDGVLDRDFPPAFAVVDFHPDGRVERRMVAYRLEA